MGGVRGGMAVGNTVFLKMMGEIKEETGKKDQSPEPSALSARLGE